ncbi:MAG: hypothetical protein IJW15_01430 [Clostridia bacterium]|nr:hypothetical protein [Clostridia bacterium]
MNIKIELLRKTVADLICQNIDNWLEIDANSIVDTKATEILKEIQTVIQSNMDDFDMIEEIVCIFEKNEIDAGLCHDFG